jgi:hypothetical protein
MTMVQKTTVAFLIAFNSFGAYSQTWTHAIFPNGTDSSYEYQPASIVNFEEYGRSGLFKVWTKNVQPKITLLGKKYKNIPTKILWAFDCVNKQYRFLNIIYYNSRGGVVQSAKDGPWEDVVPDSIGDELLMFFCQLSDGKARGN